MAASKALIERLREQAWTITHMEAADHIEVLETHNEGYRLALADQLQIRQQLEADNARLREALIRIDGHYTDNPCATAEEADRLTIEEMAQMARAALQETSHD